MAIREIYTYPDERLRQQAKPVDLPVSKEIRKLIKEMAEAMYAAPGVGLAAPQVGVPLRIAITDTASKEGPRDLKVWINPEILRSEGAAVFEEGCLSVPGIYEDIERPVAITAAWQDLDGNRHTADFEGFPAVALQHEFDHLDGILFIDKLAPIKQRLLKARLRKKKRVKDRHP